MLQGEHLDEGDLGYRCANDDEFLDLRACATASQSQARAPSLPARAVVPY